MTRRDAVLRADMLAEVPEIPDCDFHKLNGEPGTPAAYDGETKRGPWAFMCSPCFREHGVGLGLGRGQRLVLKGDPLARQIGTVGNPDPVSDGQAPLPAANHPTRRELAQAFGLALCFGPLLALVVNGTNPFGAVTWVLVAAGFLTAAVAIAGTRILHTTYQRRDQS